MRPGRAPGSAAAPEERPPRRPASAVPVFLSWGGLAACGSVPPEQARGLSGIVAAYFALYWWGHLTCRGQQPAGPGLDEEEHRADDISQP